MGRVLEQGLGNEGADGGEEGGAFGLRAGALGDVGGDEDGFALGREKDGDVVGGVFAVGAGFVAGLPGGGDVGAEAFEAGLVGLHPAEKVAAAVGGEGVAEKESAEVFDHIGGGGGVAWVVGEGFVEGGLVAVEAGGAVAEGAEPGGEGGGATAEVEEEIGGGVVAAGHGGVCEVEDVHLAAGMWGGDE